MTTGRVFTSAIVIVLTLVILHAQAPPEVIRVTLSRNDDFVANIINGVVFERARVEKAMAAAPVTLPDPLPSGAVVGFNSTDGLFVIASRAQQGDGAVLIVDANANRDLRDDAPVQVARQTQPGGGTIVKIKRTYPGPPPREVWLPYRFKYTPRPDKNDKSGVEQLGFTVGAAYRMEGTFTFLGTEYVTELSDYNQEGRFDKSNLSRGTVLSVYPKGAAADDRPFLYGYELIAVGDEFYEVSDGALDGSWLELKRNTLPHAAIGRPAPDIRLTDTDGKTFAVNDYRGRYLLLDFWPSWCGPCIAQFPTIKKTAERHGEQRLAVVGINLDGQSALETARKIVMEKGLTWRHVMEGRGYFLPIYQVLGRLPEHRMSFPLYVAIAPDGIIRYATNDFAKMQLFFEHALAPAASRPDALFVPLASARRSRMSPPLPVDFGSPALQVLLKRPDVRLPVELPKDARIGRLPNDTLVVARPAAGGDRYLLRLDAARDFDLTNDQDKEIPLLDAFPEKPEETPDFLLMFTYANASTSSRPFRFFARRSAGRPPDLFYSGWDRRSSGSFVLGNVEYQIEIADPTSDLLWSADDLKAPGAFTFREKRDGKWVAVHSVSSGIPIGGRTYHVRHVHDDGQMVKLEAEGAPVRR